MKKAFRTDAENKKYLDSQCGGSYIIKKPSAKPKAKGATGGKKK